ncbi:hypothetical protein [Paraburkholderia solisilvae]|nr:hypothetical protein [Paraburkholderia solisilvae]
MDRRPHTPPALSMSMLIDQEITHIGRVMRPSLHGDLGGAILPASYWRKRLNELLAREHLSRPQLCAIDSLLLLLDQLDATELEPLPFANTPTNRTPSPKSRATVRDRTRHAS